MIKCVFSKEEYQLLKSLVGSMHEIILNGLKAPIKKSKKLIAEKLNNDIENLMLKLEDIELKGGEK